MVLYQKETLYYMISLSRDRGVTPRAKSSADGLVGIGFAYEYQLQPGEVGF